MIKIREMTADDVSAVMKIEKDSFSEPWAEVHFYYELYSRGVYNWVTAEGSDILGYLCFWKIVDELHINNIAVRKDRRRSGIAQAMLDRLIRFGKRNGATVMTLEVNENNVAAKRFYEKNGFKQEGRRPGYYQKEQADALILTRRLEIM